MKSNLIAMREIPMTDKSLRGLRVNPYMVFRIVGAKPRNLLQHELIGLKTEVEESSNSNVTGVCGTVVDETRNMLVIENERRKEKKIPKAGNIFRFELNEGMWVRVKGDMLVSRPEDRIRR